VGGLAGDDEILAAADRRTRRQRTGDRGDVAGTLGHRYAVAFGLALLDAGTG